MTRLKRSIRKVFGWGGRLLCRHRYQLWVRNVHGDGVLRSGGRRSVWKCQTCGRSLVHSGPFTTTAKP